MRLRDRVGENNHTPQDETRNDPLSLGRMPALKRGLDTRGKRPLVCWLCALREGSGGLPASMYFRTGGGVRTMSEEKQGED